MTLKTAKIGKSYIIGGIGYECKENRAKLLDMGFTTGSKVTVKAFSHKRRTCLVSLRRSLIALSDIAASSIEVF